MIKNLPLKAGRHSEKECLERMSVGGKGLILKHGSEDAHLEFSDLSVNPLQPLHILCQPEPQITRI